VTQRRLLALFTCPRCGSSLGPDGAQDDGDLPRDAPVRCANGHAYPQNGGYLDLSGDDRADVTTARTFESFGFEWNAFDDVRNEDAEFAEVYFRDLDMASLQGLIGLDAGCGKGRYTRFLAPHLAGLVALDGSSAVEAAARNLASFDNVFVVKADLRRAPVVAGSIDLVTCLGVLHHLADPRAGFASLARMVAPGGRLLVYLYSRPARRDVRSFALAAARLLRLVTVRLPHRVLRALCAPVALALYVGVVGLGDRAERAGWERLARLPMASYRGKPWRSLFLDTFDRLSAPVEHRYLWDELEPWFSAEGLTVEAVREEAGWFVLARRPTGGGEGVRPEPRRREPRRHQPGHQL
jgi:SAM-dependent methyltransferase